MLVDPRRWGSIIGLSGGLVFIGSYSSVLGAAVVTVVWTAGVVLVLAALAAHYVWPVALEPMVRPSRLAFATYVGCVAGELALINLGSRALTAAGDREQRPGLIAAVVGLHFMPFAWPSTSGCSCGSAVSCVCSARRACLPASWASRTQLSGWLSWRGSSR